MEIFGKKEKKEQGQQVEAGTPPGSMASEMIIRDRIAFAKLIFDMTQGYTEYWSGVTGRNRILAIVGITEQDAQEKAYQEMKGMRRQK